MISVLCPTRNRPALLGRSALSLADNAASLRKFEFMIATDPDDEATTATYRALSPSRLNGFWHVAPERYGYARLNEYYNTLARHATGDWLLLWNDDAVMETPAWDWIIETLPERVLVADLRTVHSPWLCTFPAVRRWVVELLGGFSLHTPHCDTWWQDLARATGTIEPIPVKVHHDRHDLTGNNLDQVRREALAGYRSHEYYGPFVQGKLAEAAETVRAALATRQENP